MQRPPAYSAVKVGGERAYELARAGRARRAASRGRSRSTAPSCSGTRASAPAFEIECSSGTYVRTLVADLGDAYCEELERTAIGPFQLADADAGRVPLAEALPFMPARLVRRRGGARPCATGAAVPRGGRARGRACGLMAGDRLIAIARAAALDELQPVVVFAPA